MKNPDIGRDEKLQIDKVVGRILSEFKGLEPPLDLTAVRDKLKLDLSYYSSKDPGLVQEMVHTIKVAGQEWLGPKTKLGKLIDRLGLRGMLFWDQNRILIDSDQHHAKHRWTEGHEVGHKLIPWHQHFLLGDSKHELSLDCHAAIEAEANYAAGQLLFLQKRFVEEAMSLPVSIASIKHLKQQFGNSNASTLWRFVEQHAGAAPLVGIVSDHPHRLPGDFDHKSPCRHVIESPAFRARFSKTTELNSLKFSAVPVVGVRAGRLAPQRSCSTTTMEIPTNSFSKASVSDSRKVMGHLAIRSSP